VPGSNKVRCKSLAEAIHPQSKSRCLASVRRIYSTNQLELAGNRPATIREGQKKYVRISGSIVSEKKLVKFKYSLFAMALSIVAHTSIIGTTNATESANAIQKMAKDANQKGNSVIEAFSHRKRLCWDGNDPDESVQTDYVSMKIGLIGVEASVRMGAIAHHTPPALDSLIEFRLAVADAALKSNCLRIADEQYRAVLKNDPEGFFERYRDLAKIGVDDVRERRAAQAALDQTRASPSRIPWELVGDWLPYSDGFPLSDIGKCRPASPSEAGPFVLKPDGSWDHLFPNPAASHCILTATPLSANSKNDWLVSSTCQPQITEFWMQTGSARDNITTHEYYDYTGEGGKKIIGNIKVRFRRCD
jgi:hypothetical protein